MKRFIVLVTFVGLLTACHNTSFDSEKWKSWQEREQNMHERLDMVDDFISNYEIPGKPKSEIIDLLGSPDDTATINSSTWNYNLGPCRGIFSGISYGSLTIKFENNVAVEISKYCH